MDTNYHAAIVILAQLFLEYWHNKSLHPNLIPVTIGEHQGRMKDEMGDEN